MQTYSHSARTTDLGPWFNRFNPVWWLLNADRKFDPAFTFFNFLIDERHPDWLRTLLFAIRNPGHNLTFYVLGVAHKDFIRVGNHPETCVPSRGRMDLGLERGFLVEDPSVLFLQRKG